MLRKDYFVKILVVFGVATLLSSLMDLLVIFVPPHLNNAQWVFFTAQEVAERSIIPILGIILIFGGLYFNNENNKITLNIEKILSIFTISFGVGLVLVSLLYLLTTKSIENQAIMNLKQKNENIKNRIMTVYSQEKMKPQVKNINIDKYIKKLDNNLVIEMKLTSRDLLKKNVKTVVNLLLFAFAYLFTGIIAFKSSNISLKKLRYSNNSG